VSLERARALEAEGDADGAAREFVAVGAYDEAARVLTLALRPLDAAIVLLTGIDMIASDLEPPQRARAQMAASLLREGGRDDHARRVLDALQGGAAFPSAVLRSVLTAAEPAPRTSARPTASAPPTEARRPASPFVVRASIPPSGQGVPRPSVAPAGTAPAPVGIAPASIAPASAAPATPPPVLGSLAPPPMTTPPTRAALHNPPPAAADPDRYRAEAGWHAADGAAIEETIRQFLATNRKGAAARVAWEAGQFARALDWFIELDLKYQAGSCLRSLGRAPEALAMLLEVPLTDTRYRRACFDIVALAKETGRLDFEVDRFLTSFVGEGPKDDTECGGFLELADLYAAAGFALGARRCAEGVLRITPDDARAKALATPTASASGRARSPYAAPGDLTALPSVDEFAALARKHAPPRPSVRK
jgi:hypothetical protein